MAVVIIDGERLFVCGLRYAWFQTTVCTAAEGFATGVFWRGAHRGSRLLGTKHDAIADDIQFIRLRGADYKSASFLNGRIISQGAEAFWSPRAEIRARRSHAR